MSDFLSKAKADGQVFVKTVGLLTQLGKLKLQISAKEKEKDQMLHTVGATVFEMYHENRSADVNAVFSAIGNNLQTLKHLDETLAELEASTEQIKADFRNSQKGAAPKSDPPQAE